MAVIAGIAYAATLTGDVAGSLPTLAAFNNATSPAQRQVVALSAGANTITPAAGSRMAILVPPSGSTNGKTLKGITGDTGVPLDAAAVACIPLPAGPGTFVITSIGTENLTIYWF